MKKLFFLLMVFSKAKGKTYASLFLLLLVTRYSFLPVNSFAQDSLRLLISVIGENQGDYFGVTSGIGDVNDDGYADVAVGVFKTGKVKIYFGGSPMDTIPDIILAPPRRGFGSSVAGAGDVNGDGYRDIILGDPGFGFSRGKCYLYFGGANMDTVPDFEMTGKAERDRLGYVVAGVGDVNEDGYDDFAMSSFNPNGPPSFPGEIFICFGGRLLDSLVDVHIVGDTLDELGWSISKAGDVNGDGFDDVLVGVPRYEENGEARIYFGGVNMDSLPDVTLTGDTPMEVFGRCVAGAGDVNGDGFSDVMVAVQGHEHDLARIFFGGIEMDRMADVRLVGRQEYDFFRFSLSAADDLNHDGFGDVMVGAITGYANIERVYCYLGGTSMDSIPDFYANGEKYGDDFGRYIVSAGDVNGDGYNEVLVGADSYNNFRGKVYLYTTAPNSSVKTLEIGHNSLNFKLFQNYPNPFNIETVIRYRISDSGYPVTLRIYSLSGDEVGRLVDQKQALGNYSIRWDGRNNEGKEVVTGVYFYELRISNLKQVKKLILLR